MDKDDILRMLVSIAQYSVAADDLNTKEIADTLRNIASIIDTICK